jgi:SAM-dependent methyltransferase
MGLGKTIQVLGVLSLTRRDKRKEKGTDLLVVPASLIDNWRLEIERFAPQLEVLREVVRLLRPGGRLVLMEPSDTACLGRAAARSIPKWGNFLRRPYATMRFAMSMVGWQTAARISGPMSVERFSQLVDEAGLDFVGCFPSLGGLGMHCVAEKPGESS